MRTRRKHGLRLLAVGLAAVVMTGAGTVPAQADETAAAASESIEDGVATLVDGVAVLKGGCQVRVDSWSPIWSQPAAWTGTDGTIWYRERGGGTAHLNCPASVLIRTRIVDTSVPGVYRTYTGTSRSTVTGQHVSGTATVNVPYVGPQAPGVRPFGQILVHVEVYVKLSTGRYSSIRFGCMEFDYLHQPTLGVVADDPTSITGACRYDAVTLLSDVEESGSPT